jgi:hypothetical protein
MEIPVNAVMDILCGLYVTINVVRETTAVHCQCPKTLAIYMRTPYNKYRDPVDSTIWRSRRDQIIKEESVRKGATGIGRLA